METLGNSALDLSALPLKVSESETGFLYLDGELLKEQWLADCANERLEKIIKHIHEKVTGGSLLQNVGFRKRYSQEVTNGPLTFLESPAGMPKDSEHNPCIKEEYKEGDSTFFGEHKQNGGKHGRVFE